VGVAFRADTRFPSRIRTTYPMAPGTMTQNSLRLATLAALFSLAGCTGDTVGTATETTGSETDTSSSTGSQTTTTAGTSTTAATTSTGTTGTTDETTSTSSTTSGGPVCGDGMVDAGEECDNGADNADDAGCTSECKNASCGDNLVWEGTEVCDDGVNDGAYNGCAADCSAWGPRCGDGEVQIDFEACDSTDPFSGCKSDCQVASSCLDLKNDNGAAVSGVYTIQPAGLNELVDVYCDMETDGGGYTFLKASVASDQTASQAETFCQNNFNMHLLTPRTAGHMMSAFTVATTENVAPKGGGNVIASVDYLGILAIYPVMPGTSCPDMPFNSTDCPEWQGGDGGVFYVSDMGMAGEPSNKNCAGCSLIYDWNMDGTLNGYQATNLKGGGKSASYLCDVGDKVP